MTGYAPHQLGAACLDGRRTRFCVWSPHAARLGVYFAESERTEWMQRRPDGYHVLVTDAPAGTRYQFEFEDGRRRPDPASRAQPEGVHGVSVVQSPVRPANVWTCPPLHEHVLYELHVGTFTPEGTFAAIIPRLKELKELGITAIELMPVAQFPGGRNWGYDGVGLFAAQWSYGGPEGLAALIDACHRSDIAVLLDVVYNHLGPEGNYLPDFAPYFLEAVRTPWGAALNFDGAGSDHVREFFIQNALYWVMEIGFDGLRLDAVHAIHDRTATPFLQELASRVKGAAESVGRRALLIAESSDNDPRLVRPRALGGYGLDGCWNDDYHHAVRTPLTGDRRGYYGSYGSVSQIAKCIRDRYVFSGDYAPGYGRRHGAAARDVSHSRLVVFTQNHDQVGNRPFGDRLDAAADAERAKTSAALVLLSPFTPMLWMGEEHAEEAPFQYFVSHGDPDLVEAVRRGRRAEFAGLHSDAETPDPQDEATFLRSKVSWERRRSPAGAARLEYYMALLRLRRAMEIPAAGLARVDAWAWEEAGCVAIVHGSPAHSLVAGNLGASGFTFEVPLPGARDDSWHVVLDSADSAFAGPGARTQTFNTPTGIRLTLAPHTAAVITQRKVTK